MSKTDFAWITFVSFINDSVMVSFSHIHSVTVHFPIALITIGFVVDLISVLFSKDRCLSKMGYWLEVTGMISAIIAFGTGYFFTDTLTGEAGILRGEHALFAKLTLTTIIMTTLFTGLIRYLNREHSYLKYISLCLYVTALVFVFYTGYLGNKLLTDFFIP